MYAGRIKRLISGLMTLGLILSLIPCLGLSVLAAESEDEALQKLADVEWIRPKDPFGYHIDPAPAPATKRVAALRGTVNPYPESFDLRHADLNGDGQYENYVTPIRLQHPFGSCWVFATCAAIESSLLSSGLAAGDVNISEKHLLNAFYDTDHGFAPDDPHSQNGEGLHFVGGLEDAFNNGGNGCYITSLLAEGCGPVLESEDEQLEYHGRYRNLSYRITDPDEPFSYSMEDDWSTDKAWHNAQTFVLKESYLLPSPSWAENEEEWKAANKAIKEQLVNGRAVSVAFRADSTLPSQEKQSEYACYLNMDNWAQYCYDGLDSNHEVAIVGWDDNYPRENFTHKLIGMEDEEAYALTTPAENGAWLVRNSWGSQELDFPYNGKAWGLYAGQDRGVYNEETGEYEYNAVPGSKQTGYFWISYEDTSLSYPEAFAFAPADSMEGYEIYQYDFMQTSNIYINITLEPVIAANVFTADGPGRLDAVSTLSSEPGTLVRYDVYLLNDSDPVDEETGRSWPDPLYGEPVATLERTYEFGGFHKEALDEPVSLEAGQRFSVVVTQILPYHGVDYYAIFKEVDWNELAYQNILGVYENYAYSHGIINEGESLLGLSAGEDGVYWYDISDERIQELLKGVNTSPDGETDYNYLLDLDNFPIKAYVASASPVAQSLTWTGGAQALVKPSPAAPEGYTAQYSLDGADWSEAIPTATEAGSYTVETRYVKGEEILSAKPVTSVIKKIPVTVKARDQYLRVGDDVPEWTADSYTVTGLPEGEHLAVEPGVRYQINDVPAEFSKTELRDYVIVPYGAALEDGEGYELVYSTGNLRMTGEPANVAAKDVTIYVGDPLPEWTADSYTVTGMDEAYALELDVSVKYFNLYNEEQQIDEIDTSEVGAYTLSPKGPREVGTYMVSYTSGTLNIVERPAPPEPEPEYDDGGGTGASSTGGKSSGGSAIKLPEASAGVPGTVTVLTGTVGEGDTATVSVTSDEGYRTAGLIVTDAEGKPVSVTVNADGTYSFAMPAAEVSVQPVFTTVGTLPDGIHTGGADAVPMEQFKDIKPNAWYNVGVRFCLDEGLMKGASETEFDPDGSASRAMAVTMLWRLEGEKTAASAGFVDVAENAWFRQAVDWATEAGVLTGTTETTFSPDAPITREQLAAILYRYAAAKGWGFAGDWEYPLPFSDADEVSDYAKEAMCWMTMNGIFNGMDDGSLAPGEGATRAQIAAIFQRFCEWMEKES